MLANAFLLACRQIWRNPMRSLLTVLGIVIGVAAVITMVTVGNGTTTSVREQIESLGGNQLVLRPGQRRAPGAGQRDVAEGTEEGKAPASDRRMRLHGAAARHGRAHPAPVPLH